MKVQATLQASPGLARRAFLTGVAATVPIATAAATAALAAPCGSPNEIDSLYAERTELAVRSRELREKYKAAEASMAWWVQSGPSHLRGDGKWCGADVGWPAIENDRVPSRPDFMLNKRPSFSDIRKDLKFDLRHWGGRHRPEIRAKYRRRMLDLVTRIRRQREEEAKAGLQQFEDQLDAIGERLSETDERIENLSVTAADAPQKAAAVMLITTLYDHLRNTDCFGNSATLVALRPFLAGQIREHVDLVMEHPDHEMWAMPFYSAA